jgi:hypothetical protein
VRAPGEWRSVAKRAFSSQEESKARQAKRASNTFWVVTLAGFLVAANLFTIWQESDALGNDEEREARRQREVEWLMEEQKQVGHLTDEQQRRLTKLQSSDYK